MEERIRSLDWSATPLGAAGTWPQPLTTVLDIVLGSEQPMFVAWGPDRTFLYNDVYADILGSKHPDALGRPFLDVWPEVRTDLIPLVTQVEAGEAVHMDDIALTLERHGYPERTHFGFSYTPIRDGARGVAGFLCACTETTAQVAAAHRSVAERERFRQLFEQAPGFMAMLRGPEHVFELANPAYMRLVGHRPVLGRTVAEALPDAVEQGFLDLLDRVYRTGEAFTSTATLYAMQAIPGGPVDERYVDFVFQPVTDAEGRVTGIFVQGADATERFAAEAALRESEAFTRRVLESSADCIKVLDLDANLTFMSEGGMRIMEVSDFNAIRGCPWPDFWQDQGHIDARAAVAAAKAGRAGRFQGFATTMAGTPKWWDVQVTPILGSDGRPEKLLSVSRDITDMRRAEAALREARGLNTPLLESSRDCIVVLDLDGNTQWVSPGGIATMDVSDVEAIIGLSWLRVWKDADNDAARAAVAAARAGGVGRFQGFCPTHTGTPKWWDVVISPLLDEDGRPERLVSVGRDITDRKQAEAALQALNATLEEKVDERTRERDRVWRNSRDLLAIVGADGTVRAVNPAWTEILGRDPAEVAGRSFLDFVWPEDSDLTREGLDRAASRADVAGFENRFRHEDGTPRWIAWHISVEDDLVYAYGRHVTAQKEQAAALAQTEEALRQAQKMEAVGQLTGGIAHDFNNLLAGIVGSLDLMRTRIAQGRTESVERYARAAMSSAQRAAALTHRLLAFSRRQPLDPKALDANGLVAGMEDLLRRTIGPLHALEIVAAGGLWTTLCDPNQLESAILNLAINARDAMPDGGRLTIETRNAHLDDAYIASQRDVRPGQYICVGVTDTGTGMARDVIERAFEPFFTTKPLGQGTGLGLSMVYGFAKQSEGHLKIYSEEGKGTTVKIYLPRHRGAAEIQEGRAAVHEAPRAEAGETVLVVEDEPVIRDLIVEVLEDLGYRTLEAGDGPSGLRILESRERVDLVITDVGLPGLNGRQLADRARDRRPGLKVLFITGYAENATLANGFLEPGMEMITKPFAVEALAGKVRGMLREP